MTKPEPVPEPMAQLLDLDEYRKMRELRGDWPPTKEDQLNFFREWKRKRGKN